MALAMVKRRAGAHHQELAQITVAPILVMRPSRSLPPLELWRGVRPRKAENSRPLAKALISWIVALIAEAVTGPTPGMVVNRLAVSSALTDAVELSVDRCDRLVERVDLTDERTKRRAHAVGDHDLAVVVVAVGGEALQVIGVMRALRRDDADLGEMPAQGVDERSALAGEQLARPVAHQPGLVVDRAHGHEPLAGAT